jgi:hypothetical protein
VTYHPTPKVTRLTFTVRKTTGGGGTVPFTVIDDCGPWQTFVGAGSTAGF